MDKRSSLIKVPSIPVIVKKGSTLTLLKNSLPNNDIFKRCIKLSAVSKDQLIYKSVSGDFLRGEFPGLTLVSRFNLFNQTSTTVAKFTEKDGSESIIEKNSHEVVKIIGQNNYDTVFSALCSVISQELRIRALLALLTIETSPKKKDVSLQTEKLYVDCACQTDETSKNILDKFSKRKRVKRQQFRPYILKEDSIKIKRVVIDPRSLLPRLANHKKAAESVSKDDDALNKSINTTTGEHMNETNGKDNESLPELSTYVNEDSNFSTTSIGNISLSSQHSIDIPQLLVNPISLCDNVDHHTEALNTVPLTLLDGSVIMVCAKPMDKFHWATPEIMKNLSDADKCKLMYQEAFIHWKYCLERDEDGYLPIHQAVMSNDIEFLNRQCTALKRKYGTVDIPAAGNMTALQMSIYKGGERCAAMLLQNGADPCLQDDEGKTFLHTAAEVSHEHLKLALDHCRSRARSILMEDDDLWNPVMENQTDEQLAKFLLDHICIMCDNQGYTPLMLASKQGNPSSVKLLLEASPETVNRPMPNCGSTALYLAVEAACIESSNSTNQTKLSDHFLKSIEILMESGGDPGLENHFGSSVNILLTEFNNVDLSVLIANKLTAVKYFDGNTFAASNINSLMLFKNSNGKVDITEIKSRKDNTELTGVIDARTSYNPRVNTKKKNTSGKVNINKDKKRCSKAKVNKNNKVEIKEIKTIKVQDKDALPAPDAKVAVPSAVNVKPSHFIIVPKNSLSNPDMPKYVQILPKSAVGETSKSLTMPVVGENSKIEAARKHKNTECEQTPIKKQRKDTKRGSSTQIN